MISRTRLLAPLLLLLVVAPVPAFAEGFAAWFSSIQSTMSSMKVLAGQQNASSEKTNALRLQATQAAASTNLEIYTVTKVRQAYEDYGPDGQLSDSCYQMHLSDKTGVVVGKAEGSSQSSADLVYRTGQTGKRASSGALGFFGATNSATKVPYSARVAESESRHRSKYCSVAEAQTGYCLLTPSGMQSGDSDFSLHVAPGKTFGWDQTEAATDFVKTVAPVKALPLTIASCADPSCVSALRQLRAQEPMASMARYSFIRFVESRTTQAAGDAKVPVSGN